MRRSYSSALLACAVLLVVGTLMQVRQLGRVSEPAAPVPAAEQSARRRVRSAPAAAAGRAAPAAARPSVDGPWASGCLVTVWDAFWIVTPREPRERYHVAHPTGACGEHATSTNDLFRYRKAHDGEGAYVLDERQSAAACGRPGCPAADGAAAGGGAAGGVADGGDSAAADASRAADAEDAPPPNGWGMGWSDGWMERSALRFNSASRRADLRLPVGQPLLLVFGGASVSDMLRNWAIHVQRLALPFMVTCMDESLFNLADASGLPAAIFEGSGDGRVTTRWKYFRMDPKAFMTMGILKVRFFMEFMRAGFDILCADLDVLWLADPRPWLRCSRENRSTAGTTSPTDSFVPPISLSGSIASSELIAFADVVVSTDVTSGVAENDKARQQQRPSPPQQQPHRHDSSHDRHSTHLITPPHRRHPVTAPPPPTYYYY